MSSNPDANLQPVTYTVLAIELRHGSGPLIAYANVELDVAGVVMVLQGVQVMRSPLGRIEARAPQFRGSDGRWRSAIILPDTLRAAVGAAVISALPSYDARR